MYMNTYVKSSSSSIFVGIMKLSVHKSFMLYVSLSQVAYRPIGIGKCNIKEKISGMENGFAGKWCVTAV